MVQGQEKILVVEDDETLQMVFQGALESRGYAVDLVPDGKDALGAVLKNRYLMVFMDIMMPRSSGLDILKRLKKEDPSLIVVIMTAENTMRNAIEAMRGGAYDYLAKPVDLEEIFLLVEKVKNEVGLRGKMHSYEKELKERFQTGDIVGKSRKMREVFKAIGKVAPSDLTVLVRGENGAGKELVARAIHYHSARVVAPFVAVNCAAIPRELLESELFGHEKGAFTGAVEQKKGKFESAEKGTLFLDEIGDMDMELQAKILRVLQEKEFQRLGGKEILKSEARIVAATNQDLEEAIRKRRFREDLYHRLNVVAIDIPALRERREDIPLLVNYFLEKFAKETGSRTKRISPEALDILMDAPWSGNVRQLENVVKRGFILSSHDTLFPEHLPDFLSRPVSGDHERPKKEDKPPLDGWVERFLEDEQNKGTLHRTVIAETEKKMISALLAKCGGNQIKVADWLGINRNTLRRKMDEMGLKKV